MSQRISIETLKEKAETLFDETDGNDVNSKIHELDQMKFDISEYELYQGIQPNPEISPEVIERFRFLAQ